MPAPGPYQNGMWTVMYTGPFNLANASSAELSFKLWYKTQATNDKVWVVYSTDPSVGFLGKSFSGDSGGWVSKNFDLSSGELNVVGEPAVYIGFAFTSDASGTDEGAYVDDVQLSATVDLSHQPTITGVTPASASAGTGTEVTITGADFGATPGDEGYGTVRFRGGLPGDHSVVDAQPSDIVSWSGHQIVVKVPVALDGADVAFSAGTGTVQVVDMNQWASNAFAFAVPFAYSGAMLAAPASAYRIDANSVHTSDGAAAVQAAAATWSAACPLTFTYEGTCATTAFAQDGHNDVFWTPSLPGGVPAQTRLYYNDDQTQIVEWDMALNDAYDWGDGSGGTYDVRSTVLHELGHALGLADLYGSDQAKVMFGVPLAAGSVKRSLSADDVAGAQWIYGPATVLTLADALDGTGLAWTSDGAAPWFGQRLTYHAGAGAAQSGAVGDGQSSSVQTAVVGPGVLSYWTKVSSAPGDGLTFFVDDLAQTAPVSGEVDWVQSAVPIAAGMHDLRWTYSKDGAGAAGADCAWLDAVQYVPTEGPYGTMTINGGDQYATSLTVTVDSSVVGAASMRLSCDGGAWSAWQDYAGATQVTLPAGEGQHTIAADYKDAEGAPLALSDDITVDTVAPGVTGLASSTHQVETTWYANSAPAFTWSATDASGIGGYSWTLDHAAGTLPDTTTDGAEPRPHRAPSPTARGTSTCAPRTAPATGVRRRRAWSGSTRRRRRR